MTFQAVKREFDKVEVGAYYRTQYPWECDDHDWCVKIVYTVNTQTISSTSTVVIEHAGEQSYGDWIKFINGSQRLLRRGDEDELCTTEATQYIFNTNIPHTTGTVYRGGVTIPTSILQKPLHTVLENVYKLGFKFNPTI